MSDVVGEGSAAFVGLTSGFSAEAGFGIDGKQVVAVKNTKAGAANETYKPGNMPDYGQVTGTIFIETTSIEELETLIGTTAALTYTAELGALATAANITGNAILLSAAVTSVVNGMLSAAAVFQWDGITPPAYTNESA